MSLTLAVPNLSARDAGEVELQPQKVRKWLDELPLLNVAETARKLFTTLSLHNRVAYDDRARLELLELFRYPVSQLCLEFAKQYTGLPLPLSEKHRNLAEQHRQFQLELANGYKRVVLNLCSAPARGGPEQALQALAIQRAIRCLTGVLAVSYQTYSPCPPGTWREIHALHAHAEELGLAGAGVTDPLNTAVPASSADHAYKQALLLDFSDPYHLPPRMADWTHHYLDRWAGLSQLTAATSAYHPTCQFLIDRDNDHAGIAYTAGTVPEDARRYRVLHTIELARQAHAQLMKMAGGEMPPTEGLRESFFHECGEDLLRRLVGAWGVNPQRAFRRSPASGRRAEIAIGLDRINYWINEGREFVVSSTFVGPMPQRFRHAPDEFRRKDPRAPGRELSVWDVHDESAGGLALSRSGPIPLTIQVGDLLVTRAPGEGNPWSVGVIRWVRSDGGASIEIGVQHLAPRADPVVVKTVTAGGQESDFLPALLLPEIGPLRQPQTLVTQRGVFRPDAAVFMDNGYRLYRIAPTRLIESSHAFEQSGFDILNT